MNFLQRVWYFLISPLQLLFSPQKWSAVPRRMSQMSLPAGVAAIVALFLIVCVVSFLVASHFINPERFDTFVWWQGIGVVILLVIVIPIVTYYCVKLWMEGELSPFDDIDRAWKAGLAELARHGLDIRRLPIFLVAGSEGLDSEANFFAAAGLELTVAKFPPGPSALHWYANPESIFLVCSTVGCLSRLAASAAKLEDEPMARGAPLRAKSASNIRATIWPSEMEQEFTPAAVAAAPRPQAPGGRSDDIRGTMYVDPDSEPNEPAAAKDKAGSRKKRLSIERREVERQRRRLAHLCHLIRRARRPLCPINGMLAVLPLNMLLADDDDGSSAQEAARVDAETTVSTLKLRCPVIVLVSGWEAENGFHELIRRLPPGEDSARRERFGKGFDVWTPPTSEDLGALCQHACSAFEDWVYFLFRDRDALTKPGNRLLYAVLCRVRLYLEQRLDRILVGAFARDADVAPAVEPLLFAGCYFVAAGASEDRQAFVRSVVHKLLALEEQNELDWTRAALKEDKGCLRAAWAFLFIATVLALAEIALIWWKVRQT